MRKPRRAASADSIAALTAAVGAFISEREWGPFHDPKNLAMSAAIEAAELMEHFQWISGEDSKRKVRDPEYREAIEEEVADVAIFLLRFAEVSGIALGPAILSKLKKNAVKYPRDLVRGKPHKYTYYQKKARQEAQRRGI